jgi:hypothetical protein
MRIDWRGVYLDEQLPRDPYLRITSKPIKSEELLTFAPSIARDLYTYLSA